jgi:hypothetical protein
MNIYVKILFLEYLTFICLSCTAEFNYLNKNIKTMFAFAIQRRKEKQDHYRRIKCRLITNLFCEYYLLLWC